MTFTIDVASTDQDTFPLTCRELPEVMISCADECDGPAKAEVAIQLALQIAGRSPDLSF